MHLVRPTSLRKTIYALYVDSIKYKLALTLAAALTSAMPPSWNVLIALAARACMHACPAGSKYIPWMLPHIARTF